MDNALNIVAWVGLAVLVFMAVVNLRVALTGTMPGGRVRVGRAAAFVVSAALIGAAALLWIYGIDK